MLGVKIPAGGGMEDGEKVLDMWRITPPRRTSFPKSWRSVSWPITLRAALVERMAQTFQVVDGDIRAVMENHAGVEGILVGGRVRSSEVAARDGGARFAPQRHVDYAFPLANQVAQLGEPLYRKQEPTGYSNSSHEWMNSAGLMARMNFALHNSNTFQINDGGKTTEVTAHVEAREQVKVPAGTFQTVRVRAEAISGAMKGKGTVWAWFTDDGNHTPVQMRSKLGWGTLLFRLQRVEKQ